MTFYERSNENNEIKIKKIIVVIKKTIERKIVVIVVVVNFASKSKIKFFKLFKSNKFIINFNSKSISIKSYFEFNINNDITFEMLLL